MIFQWHSLSRDEQSKYYEKARQARQQHLQMYPGWNARDNYRFGLKKKKRKRDKSDDPGKYILLTNNSNSFFFFPFLKSGIHCPKRINQNIMKWQRKRDKCICSFILIGPLVIITLSIKRSEEKEIKLGMEVVKTKLFPRNCRLTFLWCFKLFIRLILSRDFLFCILPKFKSLMKSASVC